MAKAPIDPITELGNDIATAILATLEGNPNALQWTTDTYPSPCAAGGTCPTGFRATLANGTAVWVSRYFWRDWKFGVLVQDALREEIVEASTFSRASPMARLWDRVSEIAPEQIQARIRSELIDELRRARGPERGLD